MPLVITLAHQKGGVGKSTLASNLRSFFSSAYKTALVDIDPQGSLAKLATAFAEQEGREPEHVISRKDFQSYAELKDKISGYDVVIIDTPPYLSTELEAVFDLSTLVVVPCKTSPLDLLAIGDTLDLIRAHQVKNPDLLSGVVLTMTIRGTDFTQQIRSEIENMGFHVFASEIGNRVAYMRSLLRSNSVEGEDNKKAWTEVKSLGEELISFLQAKYDE
jgi:chromosome partitioning protein